MADVRVAPIKLSENVLQLRDPCPAARTNEPITPMAAASVAVARPAYIDPITTKISSKTGIKNREFASF